jgi:hypothetical protein
MQRRSTPTLTHVFPVPVQSWHTLPRPHASSLFPERHTPLGVQHPAAHSFTRSQGAQQTSPGSAVPPPCGLQI